MRVIGLQKLHKYHFVNIFGLIIYNLLLSKQSNTIAMDKEQFIKQVQELQVQNSDKQFYFISEFQSKINLLKSQAKQFEAKDHSFVKAQQTHSIQKKYTTIISQIWHLCDRVVLNIDHVLSKQELQEKLRIYYLTKKAEIQKEKHLYFSLENKQIYQQNIQQTYLSAYNLIKNSKKQSISQFQDPISMKSILSFSLFLSQHKGDYQRADQLMNEVMQAKKLSFLSEIKPLKIWDGLKIHYNSIKNIHLKDLLNDHQRNDKLFTHFEDIIFDFSHEKITEQTFEQFKQLSQNANIEDKIQGLFNGSHLNFTQNRAVLHTALRAPLNSDLHHLNQPRMKDTLENIHKVLKNIEQFSKKVRNGEWVGATGKKLQNLIIIGIGGSYLSIQFVYEALRSHPTYKNLSSGRKIKFLANVDPIDFSRAIQGMNAESTLILVNSKTFTTAQTMLNARSCKQWLIIQFQKLGIKDEKLISGRHICACSINLKETSKFGINSDNVFEFWDFVGGRFSIWSCIGILPLSIHFGYDVMKEFLSGGHSIDRHLLKQKKLNKNIPLLLGIIGFYRTTVQGYTARAIIPYCQALCKFAPHIQQLDMQSNGKRVSSNREILDVETAVVNFGEPGTNGQHSFFQLLHQGRTIPVQFIGFTKSQQPFSVQNEASNHDELMSNFFSQPDALAIGKDRQSLIKEGVSNQLLPHKEFEGDRPSSSLLFLGELNAYKCGQLLSLYEHRTSIQGFLWDINSYDQYGVQLGKVLAKNVREILKQNGKGIERLASNSAAKHLIQQYLKYK